MWIINIVFLSCTTYKLLHLSVLIKNQLSIRHRTECFNKKKGNKTTNLVFSLCRGENQLEDSEGAVHVDLAVRSDLGAVPHSGLGAVRPGALWLVLLSCLGTNETWGLFFRHLHVLLQPHDTYCHHHLLLLWHCHQPLFHLQKVNEQQPPSPKYCQAPSKAVNSKWLFLMRQLYYYWFADTQFGMP